METQKGKLMFFLLNWLENLFKPESPEDLKKRLKVRIAKNNRKIKDAVVHEEKSE